ncbi:MAG: tyrosine-protein phosphatase [Roseivirga sp.]|nr:tyrosine-protein phosphatase [Roseivirga sp.]
MGLNYTDGCVNFRDVGEYLELIMGDSSFPVGRLYRGGSIDYVKNPEEIGLPNSVISLRGSLDYEEFDIDYYHFPMDNKIEKYHTDKKEVRRWLNGIIRLFEKPTLQYPVLVHCLSGKDRTGIVIAALLLICGIDREAITEEYLLSEGEVDEVLIANAMDGLADLGAYFHKVDLKLVKDNLLGMNS